MSLASEEAAEARRDAAKLGYCNLQLASMTARVEANLGVEISDNVDYRSVDPRKDVAFRPGLLVKSLWPITDLNSLYVSTGVGYLKFLKHSDLDSFYVTPDSAIAFQMYSGDFVINLHDRFSLTESGGQTPSINSASGFGRIGNTAGVGVDWDLNDVVLSFTYDHDLIKSTKSTYDFVDRNSDLVSARATYLFSSRLKAGIESAAGYNYYSQNLFPDSTYFSAGPFAEIKFNKYLKTRFSAGYVDYLFDSQGLAGHSSLSSYYAKASINHQITKRIAHALTYQHNLALGEWYAVGELDSIYYSAVWSLNNRLMLVGSIGYYDGKVYRKTSSDLSWFGPGIGCTYKLGPKLTATLGYSYSKLTTSSSVSTDSYTQNRLALNVSYTF